MDNLSPFDLETTFVLMWANILLTVRHIQMAPTHLHEHIAPLQAGGLGRAGEAPDPGERMRECLTTEGDPRLEGRTLVKGPRGLSLIHI